jgi:hypothetical protein
MSTLLMLGATMPTDACAGAVLRVNESFARGADCERHQ